MIFISYFLFFQLWGYLVDGDVPHKSDGDVNLVMVYAECSETDENEYLDIQTNSAMWIVDRLNILEVFPSLDIGLEVHEACENEEYFEILFDIFNKSKEKYILGIISDVPLSTEVRSFADTLKLNLKHISRDFRYLIRSSVQLLESLEWTENVTVFVHQENMVDELFDYSRSKQICIEKVILYKKNYTHNFEIGEGPFMIFGDKHQLTDFIGDNEFVNDFPLIIVPTDGSMINGIGESSYIILPTHIPLTDSSEKISVTPSPLLFEIAQPILTYTEFLRIFLKLNCNDTQDKLNCLKTHKFQFSNSTVEYTDDIILKTLKIEALKNNFLLDIYRVENESEEFFKIGYHSKQPLSKVFTYNIFDDTLSNLYSPTKNKSKMNFCAENYRKCEISCQNFQEVKKSKSFMPMIYLEFRCEPWILVFLSISASGILFSLIILAFLFICIFRQDVLEGNSVTTILLLLSVIMMYSSVLPFSLQMNFRNQNVLCFLKSLWTSFSICAGFSLILSRCILLSTVSKEIAYMSHIPGSVQSFLTLFIFGVQAALNLITLGNCQRLFTGLHFLYVMSYNMLLLLMILCFCPIIYKSQRNYREGKYFTISAALITLSWCFWISCYRVLDNSWKDPLICFLMSSTATILLSVIFVPRTYLMVVSSTKIKLRNNIPTANDRNGVLDVYRADARQVYDCVNIAAINAISVAGAGITSTNLDDEVYNYPTLPRDEDLNFDIQTNSSTLTDKVTRF